MKTAFIVPYFGEFKNYFQLFLNSCKSNPEVTWLIFTDNHRDYDYPGNVIVHYTTFKDIKKLFQSKFDFRIALNTPYKLCDFRPAYGYIFEKYLKEYDAWGYCDTDLIWGHISAFLESRILDNYDKIGDLGHCTIFKNTYDINRAFMLKVNGDFPYKRAFMIADNVSFDEEYVNSINNVFLDNGFKIYSIKNVVANIYTKSSNFRITYLNRDLEYVVEKRKKNIFVWDNGNLTRIIKIEDRVTKKDFLYIHMQSREMKINTKHTDIYKIIPNSFDDLEFDKIGAITVANFPKYKHFNLHYFRLRLHNLIAKIRKRVLNKSER